MRKCWVALLIAAFGISTAHGQRSPVPAAPVLTVIRAGTLIDGISDTPRTNQLIFINGERIERVADAATSVPGGRLSAPPFGVSCRRSSVLGKSTCISKIASAIGGLFTGRTDINEDSSAPAPSVQLFCEIIHKRWVSFLSARIILSPTFNPACIPG